MTTTLPGCGEHMVISDCAREKTCNNYYAANADQPSQNCTNNHFACVCAENFVRKDGKCVPIEEGCKCRHGGQIYKVRYHS